MAGQFQVPDLPHSESGGQSWADKESSVVFSMGREWLGQIFQHLKGLKDKRGKQY